jgi:parallel beta-helix repeat protein
VRPAAGLALALAVAAGVAIALAGAESDPASHAECDRVGDSPRKLLRTLRPGQTGCLPGGTYSGGLELRSGGRPGAPVTLRSSPGELARIVGRVVLHEDADFVTLSQLALDGRNPQRLPSPSVVGDDVTFDRVDVTNGHTSICFTLGAAGVGVAERTVITGSRIHDCGTLPAMNHEHGIYVGRARGARIVGNWIYGNADRGIQLYPEPIGTVVRGNVIDRNGQGVAFGGLRAAAPRGNVVEGNVITGSLLRGNIESFAAPGGSAGSGNSVRRNCVAGGARGALIDVPRDGFVVDGNLAAAPPYRDGAAGDLRFPDDHPCAELFAGDPGAVPGP